MAELRLSSSLRKFIRRGKARIRRENLDAQEAEKGIKELVRGIFKRYDKKDVKS